MYIYIYICVCVCVNIMALIGAGIKMFRHFSSTDFYEMEFIFIICVSLSPSA